MLKHKKRQQGLSIIEVLVGLSISTIIIVAVLGIFTSSIVGSQEILGTGKLERDLNAIMDNIVADIQRAGYWSTSTYTSTNPFFSGTNDITTDSTTNCIRFTYDRDGTGAVSDGEKFGYRLGTSAIQFRPSGSTFSCSAATTNWTNFTDPNTIVITQFTTSMTDVPVDIDASGSGTDTSRYRTVTITLSGYLKTDTTAVKTITRTIKIYNNKYTP